MRYILLVVAIILSSYADAQQLASLTTLKNGSALLAGGFLNTNTVGIQPQLQSLSMPRYRHSLLTCWGEVDMGSGALCAVIGACELPFSNTKTQQNNAIGTLVAGVCLVGVGYLEYKLGQQYEERHPGRYSSFGRHHYYRPKYNRD